MNKEQATPVIDEQPSVRDMLEEMIKLMAKIQDTTAVMQRENVSRYINLSLSLAGVLQIQAHDAQEQTIDHGTRYKAQVEKLTANNGDLANLLLEQYVPIMFQEGNE